MTCWYDNRDDRANRANRDDRDTDYNNRETESFEHGKRKKGGFLITINRFNACISSFSTAFQERRKQKKRFQGHSPNVVMNNWRYSTSDENTFEWLCLQTDNKPFSKRLPQCLSFRRRQEKQLFRGKVICVVFFEHMFTWVIGNNGL